MFQILVVVDEQMILNGIKLIIEEILSFPFSISVLSANGVPSAMNLLTHASADLVITDIRMPLMDGFCMIDKLNECNYSGDIAILTSHADFEYAQKAVQYGILDFLLKPISESALQELIEKSYSRKTKRLDQEHNNQLLNILNLTLYGLSPAELLLSDHVFCDYFPYQYITVIIISGVSQEINESQIKEELSTYYTLIYIFQLQGKSEILLLCNRPKYLAKSEAIKKSLLTLYPTAHIGISLNSTSVKKLHNLYLNAAQRLFYEKVFNEDIQEEQLAAFIYKKCISVFLDSQQHMDHSVITSIIEDIQSSTTVNTYTYENIYRAFQQNIFFYLKRNGFSLPADLNVSIPVLSKDNLVSEIELFINNIKSRLFKQYTFSSESNPQIQQIDAFIKDNYEKDISLDDIADSVNLNPRYICALLKKATGTSYLTRLHTERIRATKQYLIETDMTVDEIAQHVGYNSSTQLSRVFKKYENMTPTDYRNSYK